ncbi:MAG: esterase, partial [Cyclobacteriaceae bacterium]|nr:esterase [Cyclobacteriaceae bacterium]
QTPVLIVTHGYTATTFEWDEFRNWNNANGNQFLLSQVLLGGHGRTYEEFKNSTWQDWKEPILEEYERLVAAGYQNISFAGSSTGGALLMEIVDSGYFKAKLAPKNIFLIDPIVIPSSKILSVVGIVGPMLGYVESGNTPEEEPFWYHFRPQETLQELMSVITVVRKSLEEGITLPVGCQMKVYKSTSDPSADPASAVLIYKGIKKPDGSVIDIEMIDSQLHVFTRLALRSSVSQKDTNNQNLVFQDMKNRLF